MNPAHIRALLVEDDRSWQQVLSEIMTDVGMTVDVVDSVDAAIACLKATPHRLAVVDLSLSLSDHHNRDGLQVLDAARRLDPGCVTMLLTGFATVELAVSALTEYSAFTCLRKEAFHRAQFRDLVSHALASAPPARTAGHSPNKASTDDLPAERGGAAIKAADAGPSLGLALVVEDDAGWRSILSELLTDAGHQVRLCSSFGEALGCLRRERYVLAVIDLSLTDSTVTGATSLYRKPSEQDMDGYRLLASTRAAGIPTIAVSGVATPANIERAYAEQGIFAFVQKQTFDRHAFLHTVGEATAACGSGSELDCLTNREREVLALLAQGLTNKEMAEALVITTNTVKRHLKAIFKKLDVHTRAAAAATAISAGISSD
jgi:DNA-binding NarL/FixJ family response regulator